MNALFGLLAWLLGIFNPMHAPSAQSQHYKGVLPSTNPPSALGVTTVNVNPRTVVALEDTHFSPSR